MEAHGWQNHFSNPGPSGSGWGYKLFLQATALVLLAGLHSKTTTATTTMAIKLNDKEINNNLKNQIFW